MNPSTRKALSTRLCSIHLHTRERALQRLGFWPVHEALAARNDNRYRQFVLGWQRCHDGLSETAMCQLQGTTSDGAEERLWCCCAKPGRSSTSGRVAQCRDSAWSSIICILQRMQASA